MPALFLLGGFLGAGKTTCALEFAHRLNASGKRVGLISNDQGRDLVDTRLFKSGGFSAEEISGGCFCCHYNSLTEMIQKMTRDSMPDVFLAEPVGSCTDLIASVSLPLSKLSNPSLSVAPLSVVIDPIRALNMLGLEEGKKFSSEVSYVYLKQIEEAEILVINKVDLIDEDRLHKLKSHLQEKFPEKEMISCSAKKGTGIEEWLNRLIGHKSAPTELMDLDYEKYGRGEAVLGWFNLSLSILNSRQVHAGKLLSSFIHEIGECLTLEKVSIAHLKAAVQSNQNEIYSVNIAESGSEAKPTGNGDFFLEHGSLVLNIRAECSPELLKKVSLDKLKNLAEMHELKFEIENLEAFRPEAPQPSEQRVSKYV